MKPSNKNRIVLLGLVQMIQIQLLLEFCVVLTKTEKLELWSQCRMHSECLSNECCTTTDFEREQQSKMCGLNCTTELSNRMERSAGSKSKSRSKSGSKTPKQNSQAIDSYNSPQYKSEVINGRMIRYYKKPYLTWFQASNYCAYGKGTLADFRDRADHDAINSFVDRSQYPARNKQHGGWLGGYSIYENVSAAWTTNYISSNPEDFSYYGSDPVGDVKGGCSVACIRKTDQGIQMPIKGLRLCRDNCHIRKSFICLYTTAWPPNNLVIPLMP